MESKEWMKKFRKEFVEAYAPINEFGQPWAIDLFGDEVTKFVEEQADNIVDHFSQLLLEVIEEIPDDVPIDGFGHRLSLARYKQQLKEKYVAL